jgi:hypothetical protein
MLPDMMPWADRTRTEINAVQATVGTRLTRASFAPGPFGQGQDAAHYSATGVRILARSMFDAYRRIINGIPDPALPAVPVQPTGVTMSKSAGSTYTVSWNPVEGAGSYFIDHSATADGEYSFAGTTTAPTATVTRLSDSQTEFIRIRAVNVVGGGSASTPKVISPDPVAVPA